MSVVKIDAFCPVGIGGTKGIDTTQLKIFVGGLSANHSSKDLFNIFKDFGQIREAVVIPDRFRVRSRCYGFVTFVDSQSVSNVFKKSPIVTDDAVKLTVVLASSNTKPRRAHFNVRHGTSGHKPLPTVQEKAKEDSPDSVPAKDQKAVGIYSDPSLFRTANIQPIAPAVFHIRKKSMEDTQGMTMHWPNEDIRKDFTSLMKLNPSQNNMNGNTRHNYNGSTLNNKKYAYKSWKSNNNNKFDKHSDHLSSVCSKHWTPINNNGQQMVNANDNTDGMSYGIMNRNMNGTTTVVPQPQYNNGGGGGYNYGNYNGNMLMNGSIRSKCNTNGSLRDNGPHINDNDFDEMDYLFSLLTLTQSPNNQNRRIAPNCNMSGVGGSDLYSLRDTFKEKMEAGISGGHPSINNDYCNMTCTSSTNQNNININQNDGNAAHAVYYNYNVNNGNTHAVYNNDNNISNNLDNIWYENSFSYPSNYYTGMSAQRYEMQNIVPSIPLPTMSNAAKSSNENWCSMDNTGIVVNNAYANSLKMPSNNNIMI